MNEGESFFRENFCACNKVVFKIIHGNRDYKKSRFQLT